MDVCTADEESGLKAAAKIKQYNLGLRAADYRQVSYLRIIDLPERRAAKRHLVSSDRKYRENTSAVASVR